MCGTDYIDVKQLKEKAKEFIPIDDEGYVTVRGRSKNLLLTSSGQNIYPEEIESKLNNMP